MPRLRNAVVNLVFPTIFDNQRFPAAALNDIYSRTTPNCSFRRLLVDIAIAMYNWEDGMLKSDLIPKDFLLEIFVAIRGKTVRLGGPIMFFGGDPVQQSAGIAMRLARRHWSNTVCSCEFW